MDENRQVLLLKLLKDKILGFHNRLDVVTIFGFDKKSKKVFNILTLLVAEESSKIEGATPLNDKRITIDGLKNFTFGITRYQLILDDEIEGLIKKLETDKIWEGSGKDLLFSESLKYYSHFFVPAEFSKRVPLNNILKNNFWNGSHVFEWFDFKKERFSSFFENPILLQQFSEKIQEFIPIKIASLSDRLGNFIIQIPVTICKVSIQPDSVQIRWRKDLLLNSHQLNLLVSKERDEVIEEYYSSKICLDTEYFSKDIPSGRNSINFSLWDEDNKILLFTGRSVGFIEKFNLQMEVVNQEPRVFTIPYDHTPHRISISSRDSRRDDHSIDWIHRRLYEREKLDLKSTKKLIQYKSAMNQQALDDLRWLISKYGQKGVYLWDPYLSSKDILETLFFCPFWGSKLKAITRIKTHKKNCKSNSLINKILGRFLKKRLEIPMKAYYEELEANKGNTYGLDLEFRASYGKYGVNFHDRFLIFPDTVDGVKAWSLGTSINSIGSSHHIFQEVTDARIILDAFNELWDQLNHEECLIWKN